MNDRRKNIFSLGLLVGGKSERFGKEKHRALVDGMPMIEKIYREAETLTSETLVSVGTGPKSLNIPDSRSVQDTYPGAGPLAGIHACMSEMKHDWILVLACDLPFITQKSLELITIAAEEPQQAVLARAVDGDTQPLCACYHRSVFWSLSEALEAGRNSVYRFVDSLESVQEVEIPARELTNVNRPDDLSD